MPKGCINQNLVMRDIRKSIISSGVSRIPVSIHFFVTLLISPIFPTARYLQSIHWTSHRRWRRSHHWWNWNFCKTMPSQRRRGWRYPSPWCSYTVSPPWAEWLSLWFPVLLNSSRFFSWYKIIPFCLICRNHIEISTVSTYNNSHKIHYVSFISDIVSLLIQNVKKREGNFNGKQ